MHLPVANRSHPQMNLLAKLGRNLTEGVIEERLEGRLRLIHGDSRFEAREGVHHRAGSGLALRRLVQSLRQNDVGGLQRGHLKVFGKHTDDANLVAIDIDQLVHNAGIETVMRQPQSIGDQSCFGAVGTILFGQKIPAEYRRDAQRRQKALLHIGATEPRRIALRQVARMDARFGRECLKWLLIFAPLVIGTAQHELLRNDRRDQANRNQPVIVRIGQAAEENAVHHAEDRRGRADAQRQRGNHREGESGIAPEAAQRIARVLRHRAPPPARPLLVALLPRPLHAAKFDQRLPPRLLCRHARGPIRRDRLLHMKPQLLIQIPLLSAGDKEPHSGQ